MLAGGASREALRRAAVCISQPAGNYTRPASRGTCRATAVTPQPTCFPTSSPAPKGRGVGCRGTAPATERRSMLATRLDILPDPRAARPVAERR